MINKVMILVYPMKNKTVNWHKKRKIVFVKIVRLTGEEEIFGEFDPETSVIRNPDYLYVINNG